MRVRVAAVFERENEILCMKYVYGGKEVFSIPGGGVDKDIPFHEALTTEWKNELGVRLEIGDVIIIGEAPASKRHPQTLHIVFIAAFRRPKPYSKQQINDREEDLIQDICALIFLNTK